MDLFLKALEDTIWLCGGEIPVATVLLEEHKEVDNTPDGWEKLMKMFDGITGRVAKRERLLTFFMNHPDVETFDVIAVR